LAGKLPNIRSYTAYLYGSGQPYEYTVLLAGAPTVFIYWHGHTYILVGIYWQGHQPYVYTFFLAGKSPNIRFWPTLNNMVRVRHSYILLLGGHFVALEEL